MTAKIASPRRPMTAPERDTLRRLARCRLLPGSWDKRFIMQMGAAPEGFEVTERQAEAIGKLAQRYQRQLEGP